jgi:hypothetical protein
MGKAMQRGDRLAAATMGFKTDQNGFQKINLEAGKWLRGLDLNQRPLGYEPNELPGCSTPRMIRKKLKPKKSKLVPRPGVEPGRALGPRDFKSLASANSAISAFHKHSAGRPYKLEKLPRAVNPNVELTGWPYKEG